MKNYNKKYWLLVLCWLINTQVFSQNKPQRIVSISGSVTEILVELGLQNQIVGTDVTSNYPAAIEKLPKVGHNRGIGAETTLALQPTIVIGTRDEKGQSFLKPEVEEQFKSAGVKVQMFTQEYSIEGTKKLINDVANYFGKKAQAARLIQKIDANLAKVKKPAVAPKVLFIYARGLGAMSVAGNGTSVKSLIELAGGHNATNDFDNFKPLTPEGLIAANPDYILLFNSGLESIGGIDGLLKVPGVAQTNAGKKRKVIEMDGVLLTGFTPRVGSAVLELSEKLKR
ncbi:heme/hemin ABC transporter substrate-binding protein [Flectobacillus major]|jgi:iron complex transport system substrate-binding protein|uniref:heme/hemin ABC transporter substrate-binding protein n=1 Tax=Flectobacillus major TaxID=103 RepID=UPI00041F5062|nr:ABC transporter substrate-binding protein [Flectobacillus major]